MRAILPLCFISCFYCFQSIAQTIDIQGRITNASNGKPLLGVSVVAKNAKNGVVTDTTGSFSIRLKSTEKFLLISFSGYITQTVAIGKLHKLNVAMAPDNTGLQDVVVVAYGTERKKNITGSVSIVKTDEIEQKPFTSIDKTIQGLVAGVQSSSPSGAPGSATDIRIRGIGSITASSDPLWVIDGAIATTGILTSNTTTSNALSTLNPDDIETISILKDAAATSIYGSRAANGVIIVTTKKGKAGITRIQFSTEVGKNSIAFLPTNRPLNTFQSQTLLRTAVINAGLAIDNASADAFIINRTSGLGIDSNYTKTNTDWTDVVMRNGNQSQYNLSISGGDEKTQVYGSGGYFNQDGITLATGFKRYNGSLSVTHKAYENLIFSAGISIGSADQNTPVNSGRLANPVLAASFLLPWYSPYNIDGSLKYGDAGNQFPLTGGVYNPLVQAAWNRNSARQVAFRGNVSAEYQINHQLKFTSRYSAEYFDVQEDIYQNPIYGDGVSLGGDAASTSTKIFDYTWSNFFDYRQSLTGKENIYFELKAGYEAQARNNYILRAGGQAFPRTLDLTYLASAATPTTAYSLPSGNATTSVFSIANINYKDRYALSGSFRRDGSSVFGAANQYGNFYSVGTAWNVSEEAFLKGSRVASLLKLRASYGQNGNTNGFGNYSALSTYSYGYNYTGLPGSQLSNVGNPDLTWEKNDAFNLGIDFGLWKNRLYGTVEYYNRKTSNLLLSIALPPTTGVSGQTRNVGAMDNRGFEISLGGKPIAIKDFNWDISFNIAFNRNKVTQLYLNNPVPYGPNSTSSGYFFEATTGHAIYEFYLREWAGVNQLDGTPLWYTDSTRSKTTGSYTSAKQFLTGKSALPKFFGSVTNNFTYKAFALLGQLYYNVGNYILDPAGSDINSDGAYLGIFNQLTDQLNGWKKPGDITNVPKIIYGGNNNSNRFSTRYIYKGDYIRLRDLQFSYTIPNKLIAKMHIFSCIVYVRGLNLLTWVKDKTLTSDPEQGAMSASNLNVYIPKTISGGIKIGF